MATYTEAKQNAKLAQARALLAKAESTTHPAEAESLTAKATDLIAQYGLDAAEAYAADNTTDELIVKTISLAGSYGLQRATLLHCVTKPLRVKSVRYGSGKNAFAKVFGFRSDVERAELLYSSLLLQVANAVAHTPVPQGVHAKSFRTSFWSAFSGTILRRLSDAERQAAAETTTTGSALAVVDRTAQVEVFWKAEVDGPVRTTTTSARSRLGYNAGREAGNRADLGNTRVGGRRTAINA